MIGLSLLGPALLAAAPQSGTVVMADPASGTLWVREADGASRFGSVAPDEAAPLRPGSTWSWEVGTDGVWQDFWPAEIDRERNLIDTAGNPLSLDDLDSGTIIRIYARWQDDTDGAVVLRRRVRSLLALRDEQTPGLRIVVIPQGATSPSPAAIAQADALPWITGSNDLRARLRPQELYLNTSSAIAIYQDGQLRSLRRTAYWNPAAMLKLARLASKD
ncbi:MAG: hypothetical protein E1N59_2342 [Puniceicoccaceae bacterium 5H]|nr:MAG: hypothetical protein E1N59_2342 [Puniceicoccaceae bacterium 5H]